MFDEYPRLYPHKYDITLVCASNPELREKFHKTDRMEAKTEERKEAMTELMVKDPFIRKYVTSNILYLFSIFNDLNMLY